MPNIPMPLLGHSFEDALGIRTLPAREDGLAEAELEVTERCCQPFGMVHGGVNLALAENLAGHGSMRLCGRGSRVRHAGERQPCGSRTPWLHSSRYRPPAAPRLQNPSLERGYHLQRHAGIHGPRHQLHYPPRMSTDPQAVMHLLDGACRSRCSFALFRRPNDDDFRLVVQRAADAEVLPDIAALAGRSGFVAVPFRVSADCPPVLIHADATARSWDEMAAALESLHPLEPLPVASPEPAFGKAEYMAAFGKAMDVLGPRSPQGGAFPHGGGARPAHLSRRVLHARL